MREIKPIPLSHIDEAASIEAACLGSAWSAEQLADSVGRPDFCYIGAFEDGILTAVCSYYLVAGEVQIVNLAVLPAYRRRGAGRALLNAVRADARTRGCGRILLEYEKGNRAAEALYFSEGFRTVGERRGFYHGTDAVLADLEI